MATVTQTVGRRRAMYARALVPKLDRLQVHPRATGANAGEQTFSGAGSETCLWITIKVIVMGRYGRTTNYATPGPCRTFASRYLQVPCGKLNRERSARSRTLRFRAKDEMLC